MATEKKTTAKKTTAKKAACKKTACKKTTKAAAVKHIGLVKNDPYLADYEDAIRGRTTTCSGRWASLPTTARPP